MTLRTAKQLETYVRKCVQQAGFRRRPTVTMWTDAEERRAKRRDHAYVYTDDLAFHFSKKTLALDDAHRRALIAHEVGHCLAQREWGSSTEDEADAAAAQFLGTSICYDKTYPGKGLQVVCSRSRVRNPSGVRRGTPPQHLADYLKSSEIEARYRGHYFTGDTKIASSRTTPAPSSIPIGTWRYDDNFKGVYGHEIDELVEIDPHELDPREFSWDRVRADLKMSGKLEDAERYAQWLREGNEMPPVTVVQTDRDTLTLSDGHRRTYAAVLAGKPVRAWISWNAPHPKGLIDAEGRPMKVGLTYELATGRAANPAPPTIVIPKISTEANDMLLDLTCELPAARGRERAMRAAHKAGHPACEACGRALEGGTVVVLDAAGEQIATVGPDCAKKIAKILVARQPNPRITRIGARIARGGP